MHGIHPEQPRSNRLGNATSPYLLQHAHNPVHWYPWGPEALELARREDKPILLSIGYSACHWCHVMAHESFEDPDTAGLMNDLFVNIKVDREERPDLDKIYQTAHHLLTQRTGGWPLTMFLTPGDLTPFFGGTYFPPEPRHGMPAFAEVLQRVAGFYRERHTEILEQNTALVQALADTNPASAGGDVITTAPLDSARYQLEQSFDNAHAGFGQAPKFPHPTNIDALLRHWAATCRAGKEDRRALDMADRTLRAMARGGFYDQLGGGFYRYAVDERWMIPHFEKMLYDNAQLLPLYANAATATGDTEFARIAAETAHWVMREMQAPTGGYYSTLDADTEGVEGKFYVWTPEQARALLEATEYAVAAACWGLDRSANFEGHWHLHVYQDAAALAARQGLDPQRAAELLASARTKLFAAREQRARPGRDEKILTSWNALMIRGMAVAGRQLNEPAYLDSAQRALDFIKARLYKDGRLLATCKDDRAHLMAYLDDYVFLIDAILELLQARWREADLTFAVQLAGAVLNHFEDREQGGFFFTADDHEALIHRPKPVSDDALPAGNGVAAYVLGRLGHLLGEPRYLSAAERTLRAGWSGVSQLPYAHTAMLLALEEYLYPPQTVVLRGAPRAMLAWQQRCVRHYAPRRMTLAIPANAQELPDVLAQRTPRGPVTAYLCSGHACGVPIDTLEELERELEKTEVR